MERQNNVNWMARNHSPNFIALYALDERNRFQNLTTIYKKAKRYSNISLKTELISLAVTRFESRPQHRISWLKFFLRFSSVLPSKFRDHTSTKPHGSLLIYYSSVIVPFDFTCTPNTDSSAKKKQKKTNKQTKSLKHGRQYSESCKYYREWAGILRATEATSYRNQSASTHPAASRQTDRATTHLQHTISLCKMALQSVRLNLTQHSYTLGPSSSM
jgi:hypothetical protein